MLFLIYFRLLESSSSWSYSIDVIYFDLRSKSFTDWVSFVVKSEESKHSFLPSRLSLRLFWFSEWNLLWFSLNTKLVSSSPQICVFSYSCRSPVYNRHLQYNSLYFYSSKSLWVNLLSKAIFLRYSIEASNSSYLLGLGASKLTNFVSSVLMFWRFYCCFA